MRRRIVVGAAALLALIVIAVLGPANLGSLAWSHHILAGWPAANFPDVVLRDPVGADNAAARAALSAAPVNPLAPFETYRQRAMLALDGGQTDAATADLGRAFAAADTTNRRMIYESVLAYGEHAAAANRPDQARAAYDLLIRTAPERAAAYVRLGELLRTQLRYPEAVAAFQQALAAPDSGPDAGVERARADYWLGGLYGALNQPDAALAAYRAATQADPANTGWWWTWGAYMVLGQDAAAHADRPAARTWFQQAQATAATPEQRDQAAAALAGLGP